MSYTKPGYYEVPPGRLVPQWCAVIGGAPSSWERDLADTMDNLGRSGRRVSSVGVEDVIALKGEGYFTSGSDAHRALSHVLLRLLHHWGFIDRYPKVIGYKASPHLTMDECVDRMLGEYIHFPSLDSLGGKESFNLEALKTILPSIVRELRFQGTMRDLLVRRLRQKLGAVAFKIATGQPIDQAERSFFVNMSDPDSLWGMTGDELKTSGVASRAPIPVLESGDPLVGETWELFKRSTEAGPFLRFCTLESNRNLENLVFWYGPQQAALSYAVGYRFGFGKYFDEPRVKEAFVLPWSASDQLIAARERNVAFTLGGASDRNMNMRSPILAFGNKQNAASPVFDHPEVDIRVSLDGTDVAPTEYSYWSPWRERTMSTLRGATPMTLLYDLALANERLGESQSTGLSIQSFDMVDFKASEPFLGSRTFSVPSYEEDIWFPSPLGQSRGAQMKPVNTTDLYRRMGTTVFPPAFKEFVMAPLSWLYVPDPEAEAFIKARLGLTWEEGQHAERTIRVSHNYAKLSRLLAEEQLPIDKNRLGALCRALLGR